MFLRAIVLCLCALPLLGLDGVAQKSSVAGTLQPPPSEALEKLAAQGDPEAAHELGARYAEGRMGLTRDEVRAAAWYQKAAAQGHAAAQGDLGWYYLKGLGGLPADEARAFACFQSAAEKGNRYATHMLGWMYENGRGTRQDDRLAAAWHEKAANLGDMDSLASLGWLTESGRGVPKDEAAAARMYATAVRGGNAMAMNNLGWFFASGKGGLQKDYATARQLFETASTLGWARADGNLGYLYANGLGVPRNLSTSLRWFKLSADAGDLLSQQYLGHLYEAGREVGRDLALAFHYDLLAARQGDVSSADGLARLCMSEVQPTPDDTDQAIELCSGNVRFRVHLTLLLLRFRGPATDTGRIRALLIEDQDSNAPSPLLPVAIKILGSGMFGRSYASLGAELLTRAAEKGTPEARIELAKTLINGSPAERRKAVQTLEDLRNQRHPQGTFELGLLYQNGLAVPRSMSEALDLFTASADLGFAPAMFHLGLLYHQGIGIRKNPGLAKAWYGRAEAAGYPPAKGRVRPDGSLAPLDELLSPPTAFISHPPK